MKEDEIARNGRRMGDNFTFVMSVVSVAPARDLLLAQSVRCALRQQVAEALRQVDLLALPTTAQVAPLYSRDEDGIAIADLEAIRQLTRFAFLGNLTGLPAGTVPVGVTSGLPVGLQFIGDAFDEASVFAAMAHCERIGLSAIPRPRDWFDICAISG